MGCASRTRAVCRLSLMAPTCRALSRSEQILFTSLRSIFGGCPCPQTKLAFVTLIAGSDDPAAGGARPTEIPSVSSSGVVRYAETRDSAT